MSVEINKTNTAIELSEQELDLVAGGAIVDQEAAAFLQKQNATSSLFAVGPYGTVSQSSAINFTTAATGAKNLTVS